MNETNLTSNHLEKLVLQSPDEQLVAQLSPLEGGRLRKLTFKNQVIIDDLEHQPYAESFASSILFPFANRINEGKYQFKTKTYYLECNENDKGNAIHGLIYNKPFVLESKEQTDEFSKIRLVYNEENPPSGFPFLYRVKFTYKLTNTDFSLKVRIENTGKEAFPFNLGWHPYFCCDDFETSFLSFNSHKVVIMNQKMIALGINERPIENPFSLKEKELDDCFVLNGREVEFFTPNYKLELQGFPKSNFLQLYTPPNENRIAIEPMTGISDSFNHKKALQVLKPEKTKKETWVIKFLE